MFSELTDLLDKLRNETFFGEEVSHLPVKIRITYSPGKMEWHRGGPIPGTTGTEIFEFDENYKLSKHWSGINGSLNESSQKDVKSLIKHGFATNYFRRDPRYVLQNSKDVQNPSPSVYVMRIYDDDAKEAEKDAFGSILQGC